LSADSTRGDSNTRFLPVSDKRERLLLLPTKGSRGSIAVVDKCLESASTSASDSPFEFRHKNGSTTKGADDRCDSGYGRALANITLTPET
jgi:hypothetical protein